MVIPVSFLQNYLVSFRNSFLVNVKNVAMKDNLKYRLFSLNLSCSVSLSMFIILLLIHLLPDLSTNLGWYSFFYKMTLSFLRSNWKPSHVLFKQKVRSIRVLMRPFLRVNDTKLLYFCKSLATALFL